MRPAGNVIKASRPEADLKMKTQGNITMANPKSMLSRVERKLVAMEKNNMEVGSQERRTCALFCFMFYVPTASPLAFKLEHNTTLNTHTHTHTNQCTGTASRPTNRQERNSRAFSHGV